MIKKALNLVAITVFIMAAGCKKEADVKNEKGFAVMDFTETDHDFGTINQGDKVETVFTFTNTGDTDLIITKAKGSCGCTIPSYPKEPVKPGEKGEIKVSFNSAGKKGVQHKSVTITANTKTGVENIHIKAEINAPDPISNKTKQ